MARRETPPHGSDGSTTDRALRYDHVQQMTRLSRSTVWRRVREGEFPPPRRVGGVTFWLESEVVAWLRAQPIAYGPATDETLPPAA